MSPSKLLARYGPSRGGVRVLISDDESSVLVKWRHRTERRQRSWPNTPSGRSEAKAWAQGFAEELAQGRSPKVRTEAPVTMGELWQRYTVAEFDHLRPNTRRLYTEHWRYWLAFTGPDFPVDGVTLEMLDEFRRAQLAKPLAITVVNETIRTVRRVYNWGDGRELVTRNRVARYRIKTHKDQRRESPAEYTAAEYVALMGALSPARGDQWRAWVALTICGEQGVRSHAALHLQWADLDLTRRRVIWRSAWDKQGREWSQPLRRMTVRALRLARDWAKAKGIDSPWVLPAAAPGSKRPTYSPQTLWQSLVHAEARSGVAKLSRRGVHGLRRLLAGEVNTLTGNPVLAMRSIGDTDVRQASRYLKDREPEQRAAFRSLDRQQGSRDPSRSAPESSNDDGNQTTTAPEIGAGEVS